MLPEECEAIGAVKLHEFEHSVFAPNSISVTCEAGEREDGLPDWTWYAEGYKFHRPIPRCYDPTFCPTDPPIPELENAFYQRPPLGTLKFEDGETVTYICENSIFKFPNYDIPKTQWSDTLDISCGWNNTWNPPTVLGCIDPRGCQPPPARNDRIWGSYEDYLPNPNLEVNAVYWYQCRRGVFEVNGKHVEHIDLKCVNDQYGGAPFWDTVGDIPPIDGDANPFPKCVLLRKYAFEISKGKQMSMLEPNYFGSRCFGGKIRAAPPVKPYNAAL